MTKREGDMSRSVYTSFLVVLAAVVLFFFYRTESPVVGGDTTGVTDVADSATFGGVSLRIEYATSTAAREFGLGGRESIAPDEAMLFVFPEDEYYGFWMNDMLISIDIFWLDSQGQVVSIQEDVAPATYPNVFYPSAPARYVLETAAGFAREQGITLGTPLLLKSFPTVSK